MAKLSSVLGGIVHDLVQARVTADHAALELRVQYASDPILSHMPIPRMTMKDVTLKLKFAIQDHDELPPLKDSEPELADKWKEYMAGIALPRALETALSKKLGDPTIERAARLAVEKQRPRPFSIVKAIEGEPSAARTASVAFLKAAIKHLPDAMQRKLPAAGKLETMLSAKVNEALPKFLPKAKQEVIAKQVAELDLEIIVRKDDLKEIPKSLIHDVTFSLGAEDIEFLQSEAS